MRVIAGKFRSRSLKSLEGLETRPTYDRLKETLFNVLASSGMVADCRWADLFAGTGSVGIEALSRGATSVHFAESSGQASRVLRQNLATLGLEAEVSERDAAESLRQWEKAGVQFDVCFLDPPYRLHGAYGEVLRTIARGTILSKGGIAVAEHEKRFDPGDAEGNLNRYRQLTQGDSALSFYRMSND
ncbi:MAG TPA: 16S rRNA (guanine(966)-N(2))-methyltransferase RsmD [Candidatus Saccharimonadales bacterium]|nr:16S rRNA (guanine(966)-N(2))-methyltransferase RsmD [Candidatus Saccharimonadales bacterium]